MKEIINVKNVALGYNYNSILKTNFKIVEGDFCVVSGSNASGKSLLLKLLYLKVLPLEGEIYFYGNRISKNSKKQILQIRKKIGVILKNDTLIPFFSVFQNLELASEIQCEKKDFDNRINEILEWLDLHDLKHKMVAKLSTGQKQMIIIARALIGNPKILIADQPESYLDEKTKDKLFYLLDFINGIGTTIILATNRIYLKQRKYKIINLDTKINEKDITD